MQSDVDIDAYFHRIGHAGSREPTLDTLRAIHLRHALSIPFENLDPLLRRPVRLDLPSVGQKLVHSRRGGYCFEQNLLLSHVLQRLGFRVVNLAARVMWNAPEGALRPRTHMLLRIDLDEGVHVLTNFVGVAADGLSIGMRVKVKFQPTEGGPPVPVFAPA